MYRYRPTHLIIDDIEVPNWLEFTAKKERIEVITSRDRDPHSLFNIVRDSSILLISPRKFDEQIKIFTKLYGDDKNPYGIQFAIIDFNHHDRMLIESIIRGYYRMIRNMGNVYSARRMGFRLTQKLTRRDVFRLYKTIFRYIDVPLIDSRCMNYKDCNICIEICEEEAISRDRGPVSIDIDICTSCGACIVACPHGYIYPPFPTPFNVKSVIKGYGSTTRVPVLFISYDEFYEHASKLEDVIYGGHPLIIFLVSRVSMIPLEVLSSVASSNFLIFIFKGRTDSITQRWMEDIKKIFKDRIKEIDKVERIAGEYVINRFSRLKNHWEYIQELRGGISLSHKVNYLPLFTIDIDIQKCTYCRICIEKCPFRAITAKIMDSGIEIRFSPSQCRGCYICVVYCPEKAIYLERDVDSKEKYFYI